MVRFDFSGLKEKDILACYLLANTEEGGKVNEIEFQKLLDQRRGQIKQEAITLSTELEKLEVSKGISKQDFELQARIYLTATERGTNMREAAEYLEQLKQERNAEDKSDYGKIAKSLLGPRYDNPKDDIEKTEEEEPQKEKGDQKEELIWTTTGLPVGQHKGKVERIIGIEKREVEVISPWEYEGNLKLERLRKKYKKEVKK